MKTKYIIAAILGIVFLASPYAYSQGELVDTVAIVIPDQFIENEDNQDNKVKMVIRVSSSPTYTYSGTPDMVYLDKVTIDITKPNKIDEKVIASVKAKELNSGRNVTKITYWDGKQIYP